jgi:hypothetical protein
MVVTVKTDYNPDLVWKYDYNDGKIEFPWNSLCWYELEQDLREYLSASQLPAASPSYLSLLLLLFVDAYQHLSKRRGKLTGIYMGSVNDRQVKSFIP